MRHDNRAESWSRITSCASLTEQSLARRLSRRRTPSCGAVAQQCDGPHRHHSPGTESHAGARAPCCASRSGRAQRAPDAGGLARHVRRRLAARDAGRHASGDRRLDGVRRHLRLHGPLRAARTPRQDRRGADARHAQRRLHRRCSTRRTTTAPGCSSGAATRCCCCSTGPGHEERACRAAWEMQRTLDRVGRLRVGQRHGHVAHVGRDRDGERSSSSWLAACTANC